MSAVARRALSRLPLLAQLPRLPLLSPRDGSRGDAHDGAGAAEAALQGAISLLRGGVPAGRVWQVLCEQRPLPTGLEPVARGIEAGLGSAAALAAGGGPEWRVIAAAWSLAEESGAPLAASLDRLAAALRSLSAVGGRREALLAGPRATIRLVSSLPLVAVGLGWLLGFDPLAVLLGPRGLPLLVLGLALLGLGVRWVGALIAETARADWVAGLELELMWIAVGGGAAPGIALRRVADCADRAGAEWVRLSRLARDGPVRRAIAAAERLGTPIGPMLLAEAEGARAAAVAGLERDAERLAVRVLLPLGACVLPSFVLLGVVPVLLAVLGSVA